jgi:hypothetical protein
MIDPAVAPAQVRFRGAARVLAKPGVLRLASSIAGGLIAGIAVGGIGGRGVMRLSAIVADDSRIGMLTENGNRVGEITGEGTLALLLFVGLSTGLAMGVFLFSLRIVLPARLLPLTVSLVVLALGGATVIDPGNPDFTIVGNRALNVAMFGALFPLFGCTAVWVAERFDRWLLQPPLLPLAPLTLVGVAIATGVGVLGLALVGTQNGTVAFAAIVAVTALGVVVSTAGGGMAHRARTTAVVLLLLTTTWGLVGLARDVASIVG